MAERKSSGKKTKYVVCFTVLWLLQMAAAFWFCTQKQGFHEDEFYTYYSTARTNGFYVEDGKWMERDEYRNEFVVLPGERFQYGLVKQVQSWDVHPPMYYWVFHTVASFVPGVFSKWIGLSVNLFFHGINLILLTYLSYLAAGRDERLPFFVTFVYGFSPALKQVGLEDDYFYQSPFDLSGGQKRRVAIAGVLAMKPEVLILDEPTAGLDPKGRDEILDQIAALRDETGITVILVSHSMDDVAKYVDRIVVMNQGGVMYDDEPVNVFRYYKELEAVGLAAPQVTYIMQALKEKGFPVRTDIITIEEAKNEILRALGR